MITGDHYLCRAIRPNLAGSQYPDLLIAFDADIEADQRSNGYIIAEPGKPPDFVLEIASQRTGNEDAGDKRDDCADFGIAEYWRFDETPTGRWHGARLSGEWADRAREARLQAEARADRAEARARELEARLGGK